MGGLSSYAWRSLAARPLRTLLTVVGVALGVAVLFAALVTNAGIDSAIDRSVRDLIGRADLRVEGFTEGGLSPATVEAIGDTPGVDAITPTLERRTYLAPDPAAPPTGTLPAPVRVLGIDGASYAAIHDLDLAAGQPLVGSDGMGALITERMAHDTGLRIGDTIALEGADGPKSEPIAGIVRGEGPPGTTDGRTVIIVLHEAQDLFGTTGVSRVDVKLGAGATVDAVTVDLESRLTSEPYVVSGPAELAASIRASTVDFQATTALIAALALFGGAFLIFNTLSMTVAERAREVGLLRAAGATRRQVNGLIFTQALVIGLSGAVLGVVLGFGLAAFVAWYLQAARVVPIDSPVVTGSAIVVALAVGTLVTLAAAVEPADPGRPDPADRGAPADRCRTDGPGPAALAGRRLPRRRRRRRRAVAVRCRRVGRRPLAGGLRHPADRDAADAVPSRAARIRGGHPVPARGPDRRPAHPRRAHPRSQPDDPDRRGPDRRPGDDRRSRRRGPGRATSGHRLDRRGRSR